MEYDIIDRTLMMIFLLETCNLSCPHCVRDDEPMDTGYRLTSRQLLECLRDCDRLETIEWVHFSGGEPTLWREGERDLVDLLVDISNAGFEPGFTTNGVLMEDAAYCHDLLGRYFARADRPLRLYLSIDTFHRNFEPETGRAASLDNVVRFRGSMPAGQEGLLRVTALTVISRSEESLLPEGMTDHYGTLGVPFVFVPLRPKGRARALASLCPDEGSDRMEDLGAYGRFRRLGRPRDPDASANLVLIGSDYYLPDPWRKVGRLGALPEDLVAAYSDSH
jgi:hypothetical protein